MRVIKSEPITILNTNVPETEPEWVAGTTYEQAAVVRYNHRVYKSIVAGNQGNQPDVSPASWMDQGATNPYRCIDEYINSATEHSSIEMTIRAARISAIAFFGVSGTNMRLVMRNDKEGLVMDREVGLMRWAVSGGQSCKSWSEYFFGARIRKCRHFMLVPLMGAGTTLEISITDTSGIMCRCGNIVIGQMLDIGATQFGLGLELSDYSKKVVDEFGRVFLKMGNYALSAEADVFIRRGDLDGVMGVMTDLRGRAHCWMLENTDMPMHESTVVYGFWDSFHPVIDGPAGYKYSIVIKGMI